MNFKSFPNEHFDRDPESKRRVIKTMGNAYSIVVMYAYSAGPDKKNNDHAAIRQKQQYLQRNIDGPANSDVSAGASGKMQHATSSKKWIVK